MASPTGNGGMQKGPWHTKSLNFAHLWWISAKNKNVPRPRDSPNVGSKVDGHTCACTHAHTHTHTHTHTLKPSSSQGKLIPRSSAVGPTASKSKPTFTSKGPFTPNINLPEEVLLQFPLNRREDGSSER